MTTVVKSLAKISYAASHPIVQLPESPEEIWVKILRMACGIGQLEDIPKLLSFPKSMPLKLLRKNMRYQRRIIVVCKACKNYANFRYAESDIARKLYNAIRRILFQVLTPDQQKGGYMVEFTAILRRLPNPRILIFYPGNRMGYIPASLRTEFSHLPDLKVLSVPGFFSFTWDDSCSFAANPSLRTATFPLIPCPLIPNRMMWTEAVVNRLLPSLSQIYVREFVTGLLQSRYVSGSLPSVTSLLIFKDEDHSLSELPLVYTVFPRLQYIGLQTTFKAFIREEEELCQNTERRIDLADTVHTFGISFNGRRARYSQYRQVCDILDSMKADGLKVIRFAEKTAEDIINKKSVSALFDELCRKKG